MFCDVGEIYETGSVNSEETDSYVDDVTIVCPSVEEVVGKSSD